MHQTRRLILPVPSYETVESIECAFMLISQWICVSRHHWYDHIRIVSIYISSNETYPQARCAAHLAYAEFQMRRSPSLSSWASMHGL